MEREYGMRRLSYPEPDRPTRPGVPDPGPSDPAVRELTLEETDGRDYVMETAGAYSVLSKLLCE